MGHGLLQAQYQVLQRNGGASHDPAHTISQATAESQATPHREGAGTAPTRAGTGPAPLAGPGTSPSRAGPAGHGGRRGAVAPTGAADADGQDLWDDVSPQRSAVAALGSGVGCGAGRRTCRAASWALCPRGSGSGACRV